MKSIFTKLFLVSALSVTGISYAQYYPNDDYGNNSDYGNILMIIYLSSLRHARAAGRSLVTPRSKANSSLQKGILFKSEHK
jgi:hypothetical protein